MADSWYLNWTGHGLIQIGVYFHICLLGHTKRCFKQKCFLEEFVLSNSVSPDFFIFYFSLIFLVVSLHGVVFLSVDLEELQSWWSQFHFEFKSYSVFHWDQKLLKWSNEIRYCLRNWKYLVYHSNFVKLELIACRV